MSKYGYGNKSPEEIALIRKKISEGMRRWHQNRTEEQKAKRNQKHRDTIANMTPAKKARWFKKIGRNTKKWWKKKSPEEIAEIQRQKGFTHSLVYADMSEEKKDKWKSNIGQKSIEMWNKKREIVEVDHRINDYCGVISMSEYASL